MWETVCDCEVKVSKDCRKDMLVSFVAMIQATMQGQLACCPECAGALGIVLTERMKEAGLIFVAPEIIANQRRRFN